ncbi:TetR/AcrR family transcriptional regulator [Pendulispora rubella]|uniref:TetR/AcrR family transcriptional regulator n=1 Tax=Pendulispora rubella TaxID=2741070 RepID=A0ABZ2LBJ8_9BACT
MTSRSKNVKAAAPRGRPPKLGTRERLLSAGLEAMHTRGYHATGIADVVERVEVPKGTFYNHFDSKEAFGAAVTDAFFSGVLGALEPFVDDESRSPLARVRAYFEARIAANRGRGYVKGCLLGNFSLECTDESEPIRERLREHFEVWAARLAGCLAEAQECGELRRDVSPDRLARFLIGGWEGALVAMRVEKSATPLVEFVENAFTLVLLPPSTGRSVKNC